jgi:hypothetical protein
VKIVKTRHAQINKAVDFSGEMRIAIGAGNVPGHSFINKFGEVNNVQSADPPIDVWSYGGLYDFSTAATIDTVSVSAATTQTITIVGLDENWEEVTQAIIRAYRMFNTGNVDITSTVYLYVDDTATLGVPDAASSVRATIVANENQTEMSVYTVPAGKVGFLLQFYGGVANKVTTVAEMTVRTREFGGVFRVRDRFVTSTNNPRTNHEYCVPLVLAEKTDILVRLEGVTANGSDLNAGYCMILIDKDFCGVNGG